MLVVRRVISKHLPPVGVTDRALGRPSCTFLVVQLCTVRITVTDIDLDILRSSCTYLRAQIW